MSKVSKEYKKEWDQDWANTKYSTNSMTRYFLIGGIILVFVLGGVGLAYKATIGKASVNLERELFKHNLHYTEAAASFLADCYQQYNGTDDEEEKRVIKEYVIDRYPNLDLESIDNYKLKVFYESCQLGE